VPTNGLPSGTKTTAQYLALNHELFAERSEILKSEKKLEVQLKELKSPELEKKLRRTQQRLERVTSKIVGANKGLVVNRVSRYTKKANADQREEYMAAGMAGLIEAIDSYDVAHDNFAAWAMWPVMRAVLDAVHRLEHETLSERDFAKRAAVQKALEQFEQDAGGAGPSIEQIAERASASPAQVERILLAMSSKGINKTWGTKLSAKPSVPEFEDPPVDEVLSDDSWEKRLNELLKSDDIDMQGLIVFMERNLVPEQFGGSLSYREIGLRLGISGETARKAELRVRKAIQSKGWEVPEGLEE
jgi:RNA polymerase sigma factor (sigma-70 family)